MKQQRDMEKHRLEYTCELNIIYLNLRYTFH